MGQLGVETYQRVLKGEKMNTVIKIGLCVLLCGCVLGFAGCSKKADADKPIADVQAEAAKMDVAQLKAKAIEYKDAIVAKKAEIEKVADKLKAIPIAEQMGAEAKKLQAEVADLNKAVAALTERFQVYYNKLKEMGGDVSGLEI
jgi:outer membrane murein-binding lipoprotein Lpp